MMRISEYLRKELNNASVAAFGNATLLLFGSRLDEKKKGGDFDLAIISNMNNETFNKSKIKFFKYLLLNDLDISVDLVNYHTANPLLKKEIDKGVVISSASGDFE